MIHKTQLSVKSEADWDLEESLGVPIGEHQWVDFHIVLNRVDAYREQYRDDVVMPNECSVYISGVSYAVNTPYKEFDKIMLDFINRNSPVT